MLGGVTFVSVPSHFDPQWALAFLSARCVPGLEDVGPDVYSRGVRFGRLRSRLECRFEASDGDGRRLVVRSSPAIPGGDRRRLAARLFDLDTDTAPFRRLARRDEVLRGLVPPGRGLRVLQFLDPFEALVRAILGQQVSLAGARTLASRLVRLTARPGPVVFPTAEHVADVPLRSLRGLGLTRARAQTLHAAARAVCDGRVRWETLREQPTGEAERSLRDLPGIGPWTASYVLMRGLGHKDAFPIGALGVHKALEAACGPGLGRRRVAEMAEGWRPWRAYATLYLWDSLSRRAGA
jgi:AraC family transcriptional regulator of adaptative response / DNA-3-methyladenine glycosylase II